jgi:hypothetical protein
MTDQRLAELEAQHLALGAEIAKLRAAQPTPAPRPPRDEGVPPNDALLKCAE